MRYIEPHAHMVSRVTDDYDAMVTAGCAAVCEPAFWAGFDRSGVQGFYDYFCQLTDFEPKRAAKYALPLPRMRVRPQSTARSSIFPSNVRAVSGAKW